MLRLRAGPLALLGGAALVLSLLALAWFLPGRLDWTRYRTTFEAVASSTIGHPVRIEGAISLSLLPETVLSADRVSVVAGAGEDSPPELSIGALRLRVALLPLIGGKLVARELVLHRPTLRVSWPLRPGALGARPPAWVAAFSARIEDGRLSIGQAEFSAIDATLFSTDTGGLAAAGAMRVLGQPTRFTWRLTSPGADGAAGLDLTLDGQYRLAGAGAAFSGQLAGDGSLAGEVKARGPDLAAIIPAPPVPFRAEGRLTAEAGLAAADNLTLDIAGSPAQAAIALRVSPVARLDVALAASRLDLDAWGAALGRAEAGSARLPLGIDISAEAATLAGGNVRRLRASVDLLGGPARVRELSALLPGDASISLTGRVVRNDRGAPRFEGSGKLNAPNLRTTLSWLQNAGLAPAGALPAGVFQAATVAGSLVAEPQMLALDGLSGTIDGVAVSGSLGFRSEPHKNPSRTDNRPVAVADLEFGAIALDPFVPDRLPGPGAVAGELSGVDADVRLHASNATLHGHKLTSAALEMGVHAGTVTVRRLAATRDGAAITIAGTLLPDGRIAGGSLDVAAPDGRALGALLPPALRGTDDLWRGPATVQVHAEGPSDALALKASLDLGDARVEAQPTLDLGHGSWNGPITIRHPGGARLIGALGILRPFGVVAAPGWLGDGSLSLVAQVSGGPGRVQADSFDLTAGALRASGRLVVDGLDAGSAIAGPSVSGRVVADTLPLPSISVRSGAPLPLGALNGWGGSLRVEAGTVLLGLAPALAHVAGDVTFGAGGVAVERLSAQLGGGSLTGAVSLAARTDAPPRLRAQATLSDAEVSGATTELPIDVTSGRASGSLDLQAEGYSPAALLATLSGEVRAQVSDGTLTGFDMVRLQASLGADEAAVRSALAEGMTEFHTAAVVAAVSGGIATIRQGSVEAPAGTVAVSGTVDLPADAVELQATLHPATAGAPAIGLRLSGPMSAIHRMPDLVELERWLAERS